MAAPQEARHASAQADAPDDAEPSTSGTARRHFNGMFARSDTVIGRPCRPVKSNDLTSGQHCNIGCSAASVPQETCAAAIQSSAMPLDLQYDSEQVAQILLLGVAWPSLRLPG